MRTLADLQRIFENNAKNMRDLRDVETHGGNRQAFLLGRSPAPRLEALATAAEAAEAAQRQELNDRLAKVTREGVEARRNARVEGQRARSYRV